MINPLQEIEETLTELVNDYIAEHEERPKYIILSAGIYFEIKRMMGQSPLDENGITFEGIDILYDASLPSNSTDIYLTHEEFFPNRDEIIGDGQK